MGQDYHFTQYDQALLVLDPSSVGNYDGFERFSAQNRMQWIGAGTRFMTTMAAAELTIGKESKKKSFVGIAPYFLNDVGGDSRFGNTTVGASVSGRLQINKQSQLSAGIQTAFTNRSADFTNLLFYSQWNGTQLDPNIPTNEPNQLASFSFLDAGLGFSYTYRERQNSTAKGASNTLTVGLLGQHLNAPKLRYNALAVDRLQRKFGLHLESELRLNTAMILEFKTAQFFQGPHYEGIYGLFWKTIFKNNSQFTKINNDTWLSVGLFVRSIGTLAPTLYLDMGNFRLGCSYDQELGKLSRAYRSSIEFSLSYVLSRNSLFGSKKIRR